jgi:hypothetical protein
MRMALYNRTLKSIMQNFEKQHFGKILNRMKNKKYNHIIRTRTVLIYKIIIVWRGKMGTLTHI